MDQSTREATDLAYRLSGEKLDERTVRFLVGAMVGKDVGISKASKKYDYVTLEVSIRVAKG